MKILQLAAGYFGNRLYSCLFSTLSDLTIENIVYVPVHKSFPMPSNQEDDIIVSPCFSTLDRIIFYSKQKKLLNDIQKKKYILKM